MNELTHDYSNYVMVVSLIYCVHMDVVIVIMRTLMGQIVKVSIYKAKSQTSENHPIAER